MNGVVLFFFILGTVPLCISIWLFVTRSSFMKRITLLSYGIKNKNITDSKIITRAQMKTHNYHKTPDQQRLAKAAEEEIEELKKRSSICKTNGTIFLIFAILFFAFGIGDGVHDGFGRTYTTSSSSKSNSLTCQSCDRTFNDETNKHYISMTNMCKNCYLNFCYGTGRTPENYD